MDLDEFLGTFSPRLTKVEINQIKGYILDNYVTIDRVKDIFKVYRDPLTTQEQREEIERAIGEPDVSRISSSGT
jgi:small-conductance mechanosensitive channel